MKFNLVVFKRTILICLFLFFGIGLLVGGNLLKNFKYMKEPQVLNILIYSYFIPPGTIKEIESENNLKINADFADSLSEIEDKLKDPKSKYDLISIYSFQALELDEEARLQPINWSLIKNQKNISNDFMSLGGDELAKKLLPLSWGVNGFVYDSHKLSGTIESWDDILHQLSAKEHILLFDIPVSVYNLGMLNNQTKSKIQIKVGAGVQNLKALLSGLMKFSELYHFGNQKLPDEKSFAMMEVVLSDTYKEPLKEGFKFVFPKEGGLFWTLDLAEPRFAPHPKEIAVFLNAVLEKKAGLAILNYNKFSTTNQILNNSEIDKRLKASSIRDIPLTRLKFQTNFSDSSLFSQLIEQEQKHLGK